MKHRINPLRTALGLALALSVCGPLPVALAALAGPGSQVVESPPGDSLYQVQAALTDQHGQALQWPELRGQPRLVSMFYGNCHLMCPLILENAKALQKQLGADGARLGVAIITLDPARDTPEALAAVAADHRTPPEWRYLRPEADAVRALASVLGVRYRFREDGSINHTSVLVLLDAEGREVARSEVTGIAPDPAFLQQVRATLAAD